MWERAKLGFQASAFRPTPMSGAGIFTAVCLYGCELLRKSRQGNYIKQESFERQRRRRGPECLSIVEIRACLIPVNGGSARRGGVRGKLNI